ncbi:MULTISPECIES: DUF3301 domain-containing protein [Corallincola]|uniref:DUF3301 domain-containing protein n=3 Tax=Corallincola TaxID=1775176 RepID=A0A368NNL9_9GAMM|nr:MULTISPECIES: DUF3301 domain-containing protein [Corallincola]RCU51059.1 DUF3301 domain-containing protein [Corallincola holothuriorum]TAA45990.1 DUF3301 domain-containing protein [Corallincola spongiicola]TCI04098.1 DUF3301 domain-containing protein [Corallincola luteus]
MYIDLGSFSWLILLFVIGGYWWRAREVKELALKAARAHCEQMNVQLLDYSTYQQRLRIKRGSDGKLHLLRTFQFEFSSMGEDRYLGKIEMLGKRMQHIELAPHRI